MRAAPLQYIGRKQREADEAKRKATDAKFARVETRSMTVLGLLYVLLFAGLVAAGLLSEWRQAGVWSR